MKTSKRGSAHSLSEISYSGKGDHSETVVGIVVAKWNPDITGNLFLGAQKALKSAGVKSKNITRADVPGSFELPFGAQALIDKIFVKNGEFPSAIICLGCVVQGETRHFDFISQAVADGVMKVGLESGIPVIFGVLTPDNMQQAIDRAGGKHGNKGTEAAIAALEMIDSFGQ